MRTCRENGHHAIVLQSEAETLDETCVTPRSFLVTPDVYWGGVESANGFFERLRFMASCEDRDDVALEAALFFLMRYLTLEGSPQSGRAKIDTAYLAKQGIFELLFVLMNSLRFVRLSLQAFDAALLHNSDVRDILIEGNFFVKSMEMTRPLLKNRDWETIMYIVNILCNMSDSHRVIAGMHEVGMLETIFYLIRKSRYEEGPAMWTVHCRAVQLMGYFMIPSKRNGDRVYASSDDVVAAISTVLHVLADVREYHEDPGRAFASCMGFLCDLVFAYENKSPYMLMGVRVDEEDAFALISSVTTLVYKKDGDGQSSLVGWDVLSALLYFMDKKRPIDALLNAIDVEDIMETLCRERALILDDKESDKMYHAMLTIVNNYVTCTKSIEQLDVHQLTAIIEAVSVDGRSFCKKRVAHVVLLYLEYGGMHKVINDNQIEELVIMTGYVISVGWALKSSSVSEVMDVLLIMLERLGREHTASLYTDFVNVGVLHYLQTCTDPMTEMQADVREKAEHLLERFYGNA